MSTNSYESIFSQWHATTILCVRKKDQVVVAGDGQVSMGDTVIKSNAQKVRRLAGGEVITGFAGATADAFTLFERLEAKLEQFPGQLTRSCVELAKDWRTDRYLRRLEALMAVADKDVSLIVSFLVLMTSSFFFKSCILWFLIEVFIFPETKLQESGFEKF